jgi:hypothetical protein
MQAAKTIGLDIAKSVFQVHGVDADGQVVIRRKLKRRHVLAFFEKLPACLIGMEACAMEGIMASGPVCRTNRSYEGGTSRLGCRPRQTGGSDDADSRRSGL